MIFIHHTQTATSTKYSAEEQLFRGSLTSSPLNLNNSNFQNNSYQLHNNIAFINRLFFFDKKLNGAHKKSPKVKASACNLLYHSNICKFCRYGNENLSVLLFTTPLQKTVEWTNLQTQYSKLQNHIYFYVHASCSCQKNVGFRCW